MTITFAHFLRAWQARSSSERGLLLEAICWLGLARLVAVTLPFGWIMAALRLQPQSQPPPPWPVPVSHEAVQQVRRAIGSVARYTPWCSNCLAQALAANRMLHRRRMASQLYLGVAKGADQTLAAHAWLRCGELFVTGEPGAPDFRVLAVFGAASHAA